MEADFANVSGGAGIVDAQLKRKNRHSANLELLVVTQETVAVIIEFYIIVDV